MNRRKRTTDWRNRHKEIFPEDFVDIARDYVPRSNVMYMRPMRKFLRITPGSIGRIIGIDWKLISLYERMTKMTPRSEFTPLKDYYLKQLLESKRLTPHQYAAIRRGTTNQLGSAYDSVKWSMTPVELMRWKRDFIIIGHKEIARAVGYQTSYVTQFFANGIVSQEAYDKIKTLLNELEYKKKRDVDYDNYY